MISFRRYFVDEFLSSTKFYGKVLDVGGKKENKRGKFRPPIDKVISWEYLNIDKSTNPDYLCSAEKIPVKSEIFNIILLTEVIEHLKEPDRVLKECYRTLKKGGNLIATMPFLSAIHADPDDYQRWTMSKIRLICTNTGFKIKKIEPMGGIFCVVADLFLTYLNKPGFFNKVIRKLIKLNRNLILWIDSKIKLKNRITTGWYIIAKK